MYRKNVMPSIDEEQVEPEVSEGQENIGNEEEVNDGEYEDENTEHMAVNPPDSIFVSLASYRDPECNNTLVDLFTKAHHPERVFVGICQQNDSDDMDCMSDKLLPYENNIRIIRLSHYDAQGPMYARHLIEKHLYNDELFYLQIDSHMLFTPHWDDVCIQQLALCPSDKPILTTYPNDFDRVTRRFVVLPDGTKHPIGSISPTFIRFREFHSRLKFTEQEKQNFAVTPQVPYPSLFWAAGFSFSLGELIRQVPYDDQCPFLFLGEEMGLAIRYFTHGWDFFAPGVNIVYHLLKRTYRNTFWEQVYKKNCVVDDTTRMARKQMEEYAVQRTNDLIYGRLSPEDPYGLGTVRTVKDWERYAGIDIRAQTATPRSFAGLSPQASAEEKWAKHGNPQTRKLPVVLPNRKQLSTVNVKTTKPRPKPVFFNHKNV
jgi:[Skp1-protein]-hydroxyproline N-acetylglucosaminyltransferase